LTRRNKPKEDTVEIKNPFAMPTVDALRKRQLEEAHRELLRHQSLVEEHSAGVALYKVRIARLEGSVVPLQHSVVKVAGR
jgi:hypothetical protein